MFAVFKKPLRLFDRLSIQSKLFLMLLIASLLSILITGYVGYNSGREALEVSRISALTNLRTTKAYQLDTYLNGVKAHVQTLSEDQFIIDQIKALRPAYQALEQTPDLNAEATEKLNTYYEKEFIPRLSKNTDGKPVAADYIPSGKAAKYLQYHYAANNPQPIENKDKLNMANDGSAYSKIHGKLHPFITNIFERYAYYDFFLIDPKTFDVLYTYEKESDFAINLKQGPYGETSLAEAVASLLKSPDRQTVKFTDYTSYRPSYGNASAFVLTPLYDQSQLVGIMALQLSSEEIDRVMTNNQQWEQSGLGKTGEAILIGADTKMRSNSRFLLQDPDSYIKQLEQQGASSKLLERLRSSRTSILNQTVNSQSAARALLNQTGTALVNDYRQVPSITAYGPIRFGDANWALVARMDQAEAFAPIDEFRKRILIAAASIISLITILATFLTRLFLNPIYQIITATRQVVMGRLDTRVEVRSKDELNELAKTINQITAQLREQQVTIAEGATAQKSLLQALLPTPIVPRYEAGEKPIADKANNVSVLVVEIAGFNHRSMEWSADQSVSYLNEIFSSFDEATLNQGIERIRVSGTKYMAVSGLMTPRLDHAKYSVEYALALQKLLQQFNQKYHLNFKLRIGIDSGTVIAGVIGETHPSYNLWGNTAIQTGVIASHATPDEIWVGQAVRDRLGDLYHFEARDAIDIAGRRNKIEVCAVTRL
jgi:class 3 adenylate cyclase